MIENENNFYNYLRNQGVGDNSKDPEKSRQSYIIYLNQATNILNCDISAQLFPNLIKAELDSVCDRIREDQTHARYAPKTRRNIIAALRHYFKFCGG